MATSRTATDVEHQPATLPGPGGRRPTAVLVTGAGGEVGTGLLSALHAAGRQDVIAIDVRRLRRPLRELCQETFIGDVCDSSLLLRLLANYEITEIYHLAALLSTRAEYSPQTAHEVNVDGTINLLRLAAEQARSHGERVKFLFPSSIAVYGLPDRAAKQAAGAVGEDEHNRPTTMYGCNKLYCEHLGRYFANHFRQLAKDRPPDLLDFRCVRFPGLLSAETTPSGGTSDYAPEMIHAAAAGRGYACFVRPDTRIPLMTMPEAIDALLAVAAADGRGLSRCVYNVRSFNPSAAELAEVVGAHFPGASISFEPDAPRQVIVDSWPADVDDSAARTDWGYAPRYDLGSVMGEYLVPGIKARYSREA
jgi:nucleoside-diphosphate-sugar epimerase